MTVACVSDMTTQAFRRYSGGDRYHCFKPPGIRAEASINFITPAVAFGDDKPRSRRPAMLRHQLKACEIKSLVFSGESERNSIELICLGRGELNKDSVYKPRSLLSFSISSATPFSVIGGHGRRYSVEMTPARSQRARGFVFDIDDLDLPGLRPPVSS